MNHNILALIANKTSSLIDDDLIRLIGDLISVSFNRSEEQYDNLFKYIREKPFHKGIFSHILNVICNFDKGSDIKTEDVGMLLYYRELCGLDRYFVWLNNDLSITNIENISKYLEERGITEVKNPFIYDKTAMRIIQELPDDYDNIKALSLLLINISKLVKHCHTTAECEKILMMCEKVGKKIPIFD